MKEKKNKDNRNNVTQASLTMRILAGVYLLYLTWQMAQGLNTAAGKTKIVSMVCLVLFFVLGVLVLGHSIYILKTRKYGEGEEGKKEE